MASIVLPSGQRISLNQGTVTVGRLPECTISINDSNISRKHAEMRQTGGEYVVADLDSTNGTLVNGDPDHRSAASERRRHHQFRLDPRPVRGVLIDTGAFARPLHPIDMTDQVLNILKFVLLGLLYLFFARVLWAVWSEVRTPVRRP